MRSYQPDFSPPYGFLKRCKSKNNNCQKCKVLNVPQGGSTMSNLNLELRIPVSYIKNLSFVIFDDLGSLSNKFSECGKQLLNAIGFGIRYNTPIGPFRFDIAFRGRDFKNDSFFAWYLTIGQAF
jgi:translocation and assembly module TamA